MKPEFAANKAVVRVALGIRHHSGVNYVFQVTLETVVNYGVSQRSIAGPLCIINT